jgi:hypothetical protein
VPWLLSEYSKLKSSHLPLVKDAGESSYLDAATAARSHHSKSESGSFSGLLAFAEDAAGAREGTAFTENVSGAQVGTAVGGERWESI